MILLDTHVLVWMRTDDRRLGKATRKLIAQHWPAGRVAAASISFWETALLVARGRIRLSIALEEWRERLLADGLLELPLDGRIALRATGLAAAPEDPAGRFIAATALIHDAVLVTADEPMLRWSHSLQRHDATS